MGHSSLHTSYKTGINGETYKPSSAVIRINSHVKIYGNLKRSVNVELGSVGQKRLLIDRCRLLKISVHQRKVRW
jgi:hypothetical protein